MKRTDRVVILVDGPCQWRSLLLNDSAPELRLPVSSERNAVYRRPTDRLRTLAGEMEFDRFEWVAGAGYGLGEGLLDLQDQMRRSEQ